MHSHSGIRRKWRAINRKYGSVAFLGFLILVIIAVVGLVMWSLKSLNWRTRW